MLIPKPLLMATKTVLKVNFRHVFFDFGLSGVPWGGLRSGVVGWETPGASSWTQRVFWLSSHPDKDTWMDTMT